MDDDALAHAWESFATALREVPEQRVYRATLDSLMRATALSLCQTPAAQEAMQYQQAMMNRAYDGRQYRGIQRGIFGFGITI